MTWHRATGLLGCVTVCVCVAGAAVLGLRLPGHVGLPGLPPAASPEYTGAYDVAFAPLRRDFVERVLGIGATGSPRAVATVTTSPPVGRSDPRSVAETERVGETERVVVAHPFTNDLRRDAYTIRSVPFTATTDPRSATREPDEPQGCATTGGTSWYRYDAPSAETLIASTSGSDHAVALAVYRQSPTGSLEMVACDAGVARASFVQFLSETSATYLFQLTAHPASRRAVFNLEPAGETSLVYAGDPSDPGSIFGPHASPTVTADARYVAFTSLDADIHPETPDEPCHTAGGLPPRSLDEASSDYLVPCAQAYVLDRRTGRIGFVSMSSSGEPGNLPTYEAWIAGGGRYVAFASEATNLVAGDDNHAQDAFVRDLATGRTERVSVPSVIGDTTEFGSHETTTHDVTISDDGRYVAFISHASNLVRGDANQLPDVFVHDRATRATRRISVSSSGAEMVGGTGADEASISPDGRYVYFTSDSDGLTAAAAGGTRQGYLHDRIVGTTELVTVGASGEPGNAGTVDPVTQPRVSAGGRYVVFSSDAANLVVGDENGATDVFVRDRVAGTTSLVSQSSSGEQGSGGSDSATISRDGRYVAFTSSAENLAGGSRGGNPSRADPTAAQADLFVRDLATGTTARMGVTPQGDTTEGAVRAPMLSGDGRSLLFVTFCAEGCAAQRSPLQIWLHQRPQIPR